MLKETNELYDLLTPFENKLTGCSGFHAVLPTEFGGVVSIVVPDIGAGIIVVTRISEGYTNYKTCHYDLNCARSDLMQTLASLTDLLRDAGVQNI